MSDYYNVLLKREDLDKLITYLSLNNQVNIILDEENNITFDIPKYSNIDIKTYNIVNELYNELEKLKKRMSKMKTNGKGKQNILTRIAGLEYAISIISKLLKST
jgi:hypothetical protein